MNQKNTKLRFKNNEIEVTRIKESKHTLEKRNKRNSLLFKKDKIYLKESGVQYGLDLKKLSQETGKVLKVAAVSFKSAWNLSLTYPFKLIVAIAKGEDLRKVNKEMMAKQRSLSREANQIINSMSGASDLNSFLAVTNPAVLSVSLGMDNAPDIGDKIEKFSDESRKNWNITMRGTYYALTGKKLPSDSFFLVSDDDYSVDDLGSEQNYIDYVFDIMNDLNKYLGFKTSFKLSTKHEKERKLKFNVAHRKINEYFKEEKTIKGINKLLKEIIKNQKQKDNAVIFEVLLNFIGEKNTDGEIKKVFKNFTSLKDSKDTYRYYKDLDKIPTIHDCKSKISSYLGLNSSNKTSSNKTRESFYNQNLPIISEKNSGYKLLIKNKDIIIESNKDSKNKSYDETLRKFFQKSVKNNYDQAKFLNSVVMINLNYIEAECNFIITYVMYLLLKNLESNFEKDQQLTADVTKNVFNNSIISKIQNEYDTISRFVENINDDIFKINDKKILEKSELKEFIKNTNIEKKLNKIQSEIQLFLKEFESNIQKEKSETIYFNFTIKSKEFNSAELIKNLNSNLSELNSLDIKEIENSINENEDFNSKSPNSPLVNKVIFNDTISKIEKIKNLLKDPALNIEPLAADFEEKIKKKLENMSEEENAEEENSEEEDNKAEEENSEEEDNKAEEEKL